jgi:hypothetical protein
MLLFTNSKLLSDSQKAAYDHEKNPFRMSPTTNTFSKTFSKYSNEGDTRRKVNDEMEESS